MLFTTSWDDGYALDTKLSTLLSQYQCTGTFYVCPRKQHNLEMLGPEELKQLASRHELGAHTLRHPWLSQVSSLEARQEIEESKQWVEQITGTACTMFCYPFGDYNEEVQDIVKKAGFKGARTTEDLTFALKDPFTMPTSLQITPFPKRKKWSKWWHPLDMYGPLRVRQSRLRKLGIERSSTGSWLSLAKALFEKTQQSNQPFFHLWGHSHEVERYEMWEELEQFLAFVKDTKVECSPNSGILEERSMGE